MSGRFLSVIVVATLALSSCERSITNLGAPWATVTFVSGDTDAVAQLSPGAQLETVFPMVLFAGFEPGMPILAARQSLGEPTVVLKQDEETVYVYRHEEADVEIVEWEAEPEWGTPLPEGKKLFRYRVRARPHHAVDSEPISRLIRKLRSVAPRAREVAIVGDLEMDHLVVAFDDGGVTWVELYGRSRRDPPRANLPI